MSVKMRENLCETKQASNIDSKKFTTITFAIFSLAVYQAWMGVIQMAL